MDLGNSTVKTPEAESETPTRIQPTKLAAFSNTNGVLKRHAPLQLHHHPVVVSYKECLKNHAASLGGHALDGCGEFMPSPNSNPAEPASLKCAACGCHRNFHRREPEDPPQLQLPNATPAIEYQPHHRHHPPPPPARAANSGSSPNNSPSPPPISSSFYPSAPHMLLALSHGLSAAPPDGNTPVSAAAMNAGMMSSSSRKRFRTKFSQPQKDKMLEFAEKVGWKMQKRDEDAINEFCGDIGVDKGVFKVWMHNNKNTFGKKDQPTPPSQTQPLPPPPLNLSNNTSSEISTPPAVATTNGNGINYCEVRAAAFRHPHEGNSDMMKEGVDGEELGHLHLHALGTNGSSSSS